MTPMADRRRPDALRRLRRQGRRRGAARGPRRTAPAAEPRLLLGLDAPDDAAVALPPPGMAVVQSVDHFRAFIDDPFVFGQIAAAHALSDLHAMGARPWTALAVAAVPYVPGGKMRTDLAAMMHGAVAGAGRRWLRPGRRPHRRGAPKRRSASPSPAWPTPRRLLAQVRACARATRWS